MAGLRVLFLHGLESGPGGRKARLLARHFDCTTLPMPTADFEACVALQAAAVRRLQPDVVVGSSFGGAVAVALLQRGVWAGPTLLLAPALRACGLPPQLPREVPVRIVHAPADDVVPIEGSRALAKSGTPGLVELVEPVDDHRLSALVDGGGLPAMVRDLAPAARSGSRHIWVYLEDVALWPVFFVLLAHFVLAGSALMLAAVRDRDPAWIALLALLALASGEAIRRAGRRRLVAGWLLALWLLAVLFAVAGDRFGVL